MYQTVFNQAFFLAGSNDSFLLGDDWSRPVARITAHIVRNILPL